MKISSPSFANSGRIPLRYTCEGSNVSPPLLIEDVPPKAKSLALICDDPDAPMKVWVHWIVWNIPVKTENIPEGAKGTGVEGANDSGTSVYSGPCPPRGHGTHRYFFRLFALDSMLSIKPGATKPELEKEMQKHIIAKAELVGTYDRKSLI